MIAFPFFAPPTLSMARAVVSVNSSIFARVPGPALLLEIVATISAYETGATRLIACTIGIVACPPQVTRFTFGSFFSSFKLTGGTTNGPIAAGVLIVIV